MTANLLELGKSGFAQLCADMGEKPFRAKQLTRWIHQAGVADFSAMTDISKAFRERLSADAEVRAPSVLKDSVASDGTRKWLLDVGTGNAIETVFIPEGDRVGLSSGSAESGDATPNRDASVDDEDVISTKDGRRRYRGTLCVSSQAGCALECAFCSTGRQGFNRNLTLGEIIGQLWYANNALRTPQEERPITNVVMMGMGEPLANFDHVVAAMELMLDDDAYGLSRRRVTLSTSGMVPQMDRLRDALPVALAVSLHAPNDALRDRLVPINKKYPLKELMAACLRYIEKAPRDFVTFEYVMLDGVNDSVEHARQLVKLVKDVPCKFNLIPFNPFPDSGFKKSNAGIVNTFRDVLQQADIITTVRKTRGDDIDAACGQLAGQVQDKSQRKFKRIPIAAHE